MGNFSDSKIEKIWDLAIVVDEKYKDEWRQDFAGAWIHRSEYGTESEYGWEVDHKKPLAKGGTDDLSNLAPLHWLNNRTKGDDYPNFKTAVSSNGNKNVALDKAWHY